MSWPTIVGARPSDSSSISSSFGIGDQRLAHRQHLLLAAGEVAGQLVDAVASRGNSSSTRSSASRAACASLRFIQRQPQVLPHGQRREDARAAGHHHHAALGDLVGRADRDVLAGEAHRALRWVSRSGDRLEQRRLAGAVGAEQGDDLALVDVEVEPEQDLHGPVGRVEVSHLEERLIASLVARGVICHHSRALPRSRRSRPRRVVLVDVRFVVGHQAREPRCPRGRRPSAGSGRAPAARTARGRRAGSRG